jgi:micrococcal nuclease
MKETKTFSPFTELTPFVYKAVVTEIYDGDTIKIDWDLGAGVVLRNQTIRMYGINAPEIKGENKEKGLFARDNLRVLILGKEVTIRTYKDGKEKYGRWLAEVYFNGYNVNEYMVVNKLAEKYFL